MDWISKAIFEIAWRSPTVAVAVRLCTSRSPPIIFVRQSTLSAGSTIDRRHAYLVELCPQESFDSPIDRRSDYYRQRVREGSGPSAQQTLAKPQPLLTPPNVLTLFRIALVPVFAVVWFLPHRLAPFICAVTFNLAALTDWADGYLARKVVMAGCALLDLSMLTVCTTA